jgi:hypothetical protein
MTCDRCWKGVAEPVQDAGPFRLVRDPGHWGSPNPSTLVLGISKGNTQSNALVTGHFNDVAFKGIRHRLLAALQRVGLLLGETPADFDRRFTATELDYAFASVVRCSLTEMDRNKHAHTADSPNVVPAFKQGSEAYAFASACVDQHIGHLSELTRLVILLGNSDAYIKGLRALVGRTRGELRLINDVAYRSRDVSFVHLCHPSKGNGHFGAALRGEGTPGRKMRLAQAALGQLSASPSTDPLTSSR